MFVLFVYDKLIPTVEIMKNCFEDSMVSNYGLNTKFVRTRQITKADIRRADVVVIMRPNTVLDSGIAKMVKKSGRVLVSFLDDDLLDVPNDFSLMLHTLSWRKKALRNVCMISDLFVSNNPLLCRKYGKLMNDEKTAILDAIVDEDDIRKEKYASDKKSIIKIVYAAGRNHELFFNKCVSPILPDLFEKYKDEISLTFFGTSPEVPDSCKDQKIEYVGYMPLEEYRRKIADGGYDIGLAPLETNDFSKCKYYNKFIEYTVSGIPAIYSDTEPYSFVVSDGINGLLSENTPRKWFSAICRFIDDPDLRKNCIDNAVDQVKRDYSRDKIVTGFKKSIEELRGTSDKEAVCGNLAYIKVNYFLERISETMILFFVYLKNTGIRATINKCFDHISESLSDKGQK